MLNYSKEFFQDTILYHLGNLGKREYNQIYIVILAADFTETMTVGVRCLQNTECILHEKQALVTAMHSVE